jgi:cell division septation protein DedD
MAASPRRKAAGDETTARPRGERIAAWYTVDAGETAVSFPAAPGALATPEESLAYSRIRPQPSAAAQHGQAPASSQKTSLLGRWTDDAAASSSDSEAVRAPSARREFVQIGTFESAGRAFDLKSSLVSDHESVAVARFDPVQGPVYSVRVFDADGKGRDVAEIDASADVSASSAEE